MLSTESTLDMYGYVINGNIIVVSVLNELNIEFATNDLFPFLLFPMILFL